MLPLRCTNASKDRPSFEEALDRIDPRTWVLRKAQLEAGLLMKRVARDGGIRKEVRGQRQHVRDQSKQEPPLKKMMIYVKIVKLGIGTGRTESMYCLRSVGCLIYLYTEQAPPDEWRPGLGSLYPPCDSNHENLYNVATVDPLLCHSFASGCSSPAIRSSALGCT